MTSTAGLTTSLRTLLNALQTTQSSLNETSGNIANVNTTGYTRRIVSQEAQYTSGEGVGVSISGVRRSIDEFLLKSIRGQLSKVGESTIKNTYFDRLQQFTYGNPNSSFTITNSLNSFFSRLQGFSGDPASAVQRNLVVTSANDFTNTVNELSKNIQTERFNADSEIDTTIDTLSNTLNNLADINKAIAQSVAVGGDVNSLYDARDMQLNKVKGIIDADFAFDKDGQVSVSLSSAELLGFSTRYTIEYNKASSVDNFINDVGTGAITITGLDQNGNKTANVQTLLSASNATNKVDNIPDGTLRGLLDIRDVELPKMLQQLDNFVYTFANQFNEIHNAGTGYPPPQSLTGTTAMSLSDTHFFSGKTRIALTDSEGNPVSGRYGEDMTPLTIDFDKFESATGGFGSASVQDIIKEINSYYGSQPAHTANIGSANDIRMASVSNSIISSKASGNITFTTQPTAGNTLVINGTTITFVSGTPAANQVQIGATLGGTLQNLADTLNASADVNIDDASYEVSGLGVTATIKKSGTSGNAFTLNAAGTSVATASGATLSGGANASGNFTFDFDFSNLSPDGKNITFDVTQLKVNGGSFSPATFNTYTQNAGERTRTNQDNISNDTLSVNLSGLNLQEGDTFNVTATIQVDDGSGNLSTEDVTYTVTVPDPDDSIKNTRYEATAIGTGDGELVSASNTAGFMTAKLVDSDGNEITDAGTPGYLKIETANGSYRVSIDQLDSKEKGTYGVSNPLDTATNEGFSHFFGLNNFFTFGDKTGNSAYNIAVRSDIAANPSLLSGGKVKQSVSVDGKAVYTYGLGSGSNESSLELVKMQDTNLTFAASGGLPEIKTSVNFYATEIYNYAATAANNAKAEADKNNLLQTTLQSKFDDISGVNIDEELGNTIQIQNTYAAAAKVLGVVRDLFQKIEDVLT